MTLKESDIIYVDQRPLKYWERLYLPAIIKGLWLTIRHVFRRKRCMQYPEQRREHLKVSQGGLRNTTYRGLHRLNKDSEGRVACVACFMCQTACPAECIHIVGAEAPWPDREKYPVSFWIDELRCIYCGMCEQACPVDAIELTPVYNLTGISRKDMIYDKERLLDVYEKTKEIKPRRNPPIVGYSCDYLQEAVAHRKNIEDKENEIS